MAALKQDIDRILNQARVKLTGSSDAAIKGELFEVFHEFFNDTSAWQEDIQISITPNTVDYSIQPGQGGTIIRLLGVVDANKISQPAILNGFDKVRFRDPYSQASTFTATVIKNVVLPNAKDGIPVVPDWVLPVFGQTILNGVIGKMMAQPNKSYFNDPMSTYHLKKFRDGIAQARVAILRNNTFGTQAWSFPQGFRTFGRKGGISIGRATGAGF